MLATDLCKEKVKFETIFPNLKGLFQEPLPNYYWYSFECILLAKSKYGNKNLNLEFLLKTLKILVCGLHSTSTWGGLGPNVSYQVPKVFANTTDIGIEYDT